MPVSMASLMPFSTAGTYSRGTEPPMILFSNTKPPPASFGSTSMYTSPYWPRPPVCRTNLPWASPLRRMVSR